MSACMNCAVLSQDSVVFEAGQGESGRLPTLLAGTGSGCYVAQEVLHASAWAAAPAQLS
jgi:hypothetical protein